MYDGSLHRHLTTATCALLCLSALWTLDVSSEACSAENCKCAAVPSLPKQEDHMFSGSHEDRIPALQVLVLGGTESAASRQLPRPKQPRAPASVAFNHYATGSGLWVSTLKPACVLGLFCCHCSNPGVFLY